MHPILEWLVPGEKRKKLESILLLFNNRTPMLDNTFLAGLPLSEVAELFEATPTDAKVKVRRK